MDKIKLTATNSTGTYAEDETGTVWATFSTGGWVTCAVCGKHISGGWQKGKFGEEQTYYCLDHIERVWPEVR